MDIDFTALDNLAKPEATTEEKSKTPQQAPTLQKKADNRKQQLEFSADVLKVHQEAKRKTTLLISDITKGLQQGEDIHDLFLKALEALALTTNAPDFYQRSRETLKTVYGVGLGEARPLEIELEDIRRRLERLQTALKQADGAEEQRRLKNAIKAHEKRVEKLTASD